MKEVLSPAQIRRNKRDAEIVSYAIKIHGLYSTKLAMYMAIAEHVGCSHITVVKVLRKAGL